VSIFTSADIPTVRAVYLSGVIQTYLAGQTYTDAQLLQVIQNSEKECSRQLKVQFEPTYIFSGDPQDPAIVAQVAALPAGAPVIYEPGYDYDPNFFRGESWGFIVTRQKPIIAVTEIRFIYPTPTTQVFSIPLSWLRIDRKYGHIRMVPASQQFVMPLGAFLLQALGGGEVIPNMIQLTYQAGLQNARADFPDLADVIQKKAVLSLVQNNLTFNQSTGLDGMSKTLSFDPQKYEDIINLKLFGPKGANGGLWTAIHGAGGSVLGVIA
jgi:hypothetical protein